MDFNLTDAQKALQKKAREFAIHKRSSSSFVQL